MTKITGENKWIMAFLSILATAVLTLAIAGANHFENQNARLEKSVADIKELTIATNLLVVRHDEQINQLTKIIEKLEHKIP